MSCNLFNIYLICIILLALVLFYLDQSTEFDFTVLFIFECLITFLITCYIYSYYSEEITAKSFGVGDDIYDSLWYRLPLEQQKAIILIIDRSQREFRLTGLGMVDCSLATFLAVIILFLFLQFQFISTKN